MATVHAGKLFSCGNHSLETTKGMLHFGDPSQTVCILSVPSTMTVRDVIQFLNPSMQEIENTRIVREVNHDSTYIVLLTFRSQEAAVQFYTNYDRAQFNSIEDHVCKLLYVTRMETFTEDPAKIEESSNCAVCLDGMYTEVESIITILCNHSFHAHCLSKWGDTSCPVCRYCQTPECQVENKCMDCSYEGESLWMCVICGYIACGRYINGHAYDHFAQTQHTYAMQLTDNQVWDYAGDNYVHRLLANKSDGKPVEVEGADAYRQAEEKVEGVQLEYTYLLTQQLESQRKYYERLMKEAEKKCQNDIAAITNDYKRVSENFEALEEKYNRLVKDNSAIEKKLKKTQANLTKTQSSLTEEKQLNISLTLNQEQFKQKLNKLAGELEEKMKRICDLEEQQRDLMFFVEARGKIENSITDNELSRSEMDTSQIILQPQPSPSTSSGMKSNRRKKK
uniref:BRCA1-associated protein n=1 Tax=Aceria tosichella TaxID=561515 RepID=A0A6G1SEX2_9ACAR